MTYGYLLLFAFVRTISYKNWFVNVELYYLQLFTIIAYHLHAHIMLLQQPLKIVVAGSYNTSYVITFDIWKV